MKKILSIAIAFTLLLMLFACGNKSPNIDTGKGSLFTPTGEEGSTGPSESYPSIPDFEPSQTLTTSPTIPRPQKCYHEYDGNGICTTCGALKPTEGLAYRLNEDGASYSFAGIGNCYGIENVVIADTYNDLPVTAIADDALNNQKQVLSVVIPLGISHIGEMAFSGCERLTDIILPQGVTHIGADAFSRCAGLKAITLPDTVTEIDSSAFFSCTALESITLPKGLKKISDSLLRNCTALHTVTIPQGVIEIGDWAFYGCTALNDVVLPEGLHTIATLAFRGCSSLTSISIPDSILRIANNAFDNCNLSYHQYDVGLYLGNASNPYAVLVQITDNFTPQILIHQDTKMLAYGALKGAQIQGITLPEGLNSIEDFAFSSSGLTSVAIPNSVTYIGDEVFSQCWGLVEVILPSGITEIGHKMFYECENLAQITLPNSITSIGEYAFHKCRKLTNIEIPASVVTIMSHAFERCENLTNVTLSLGLGTIGEDAFRECYSLTEIVIPESVHSIGRGAFNFCTALNSVTFRNDGINNNSLEIGSYAFGNCEKLTGITLPGYVTMLDYGTFNGCKNLNAVNFAGTVEQWLQITLKNEWKGDAPFAKITCSDGEVAL